MGRSQSKVKMPNNPWEAEQYRRQMHEQRRKEIENDLKRQKKAEKKRMKKGTKLDVLKTPQPPTRPTKETDADQDVIAKRRMQNQLALDSQSFVLNQIMLSIQFYSNYRRDMWEAVALNRKQENDITSKISKHFKVAILPDRLQEAVNQRVKFQPRHGPNKHKMMYLHQQTLYIVYENIEITHPGEPSLYSYVTDAPIYKMEIDIPLAKTKKDLHVGYVRLKSAETIKKLVAPLYSPSDMELDTLKPDESSNGVEKLNVDENGNTNCIEDDDEEVVQSVKLKSRDSMMIIPRPKSLIEKHPDNNTPPNGTAQSSNSTSSPSSSEYDYAYITALNTHQPLSSMMSANESHTPMTTTALPDSCITNVTLSSIDEDEDGYDSEEEHTEETKQFLNSKAFLATFINLFQETFAFDLGINSECLDNATCKGATIYSYPWEIIPAISCPWPRDAFEWMHRQREVIENPLTRQKFQWPTPAMVNKVMEFGCHVIPLGYAPKNGINPNRELEWKIIFPEAERYLESCLTNTQIKVYMITKALLKTFVEPNIDPKQNMFTTEHLRAHLFWQCENNYAAWPEDHLGETLIRFLNSLLEHIKRQRLPDYFLPKRNLFENIPEKILVELHKRIFRITENPVMHLIVAVRNLKFHSEFYPRLNYKKLYNTIVIDNPLKILNPVLGMNTEVDNAKEEFSDQENEVALGAIGHFQKVDKTDKSKRRRTRRVQFMEAEKNKKKLELERRKESIESIDLKFDFMKHMEHLRRMIIYNMFIEHFLEMAKYSNVFKSFNQSLTYLTQSKRLCSLLEDDQRKDDALEFMQKMRIIHKEVMESQLKEGDGRPELPTRDSMMQNLNKLKIRIQPSVSKKQSEWDPYTNIDSLRPSSFSPATNASTDDDEDCGFSHASSNEPKKSILRKPTGLSGRKGKKSFMTNVQIHSSTGITFEREASRKSVSFAGPLVLAPTRLSAKKEENTKRIKDVDKIFNISPAKVTLRSNEMTNGNISANGLQNESDDDDFTTSL